MSADNERIAVPTNARGPRTDPDPIEPGAPARPALELPASGPTAAPFNPTQLLLGFTIVASIVAIVARRLRRRSGRPRSVDGG